MRGGLLSFIWRVNQSYDAPKKGQKKEQVRKTLTCPINSEVLFKNQLREIVKSQIPHVKVVCAAYFLPHEVFAVGEFVCEGADGFGGCSVTCEGGTVAFAADVVEIVDFIL